MRGYIRKQGKNSWRIEISLGTRDENGRYKYYRETVKGSKKEAERRCAELIVQLERGINIAPEKITFGEYLDKWLNDYGRSNLSRRTLYDYAEIVNCHIKPELGSIPLCKLHPTHLRDLYTKLLREGRRDNKKTADKGLSPAYVKKIHAVIHEALTHAVKWELVYRNVADAVDPPKVERSEVVPLSEEEIGLLLDALKGTYLYVPTYIAIATGARLSEVLGLRWSDVDLKRKTITIRQAQKLEREREGDKIKYKIVYGSPKNKKGRTIDIPLALVKLLEKHKLQQKKDRLAFGELYHDNNLVCCWEDGRPINNSTFGSYFRQIARKVGLHISFHTLRHSHASLLLKMNENLKTISARLGHSGIGITADLYTHLFPDAQREAARKIDSILADKQVN